MKCDKVRETLPDLAAGMAEPSEAVQEHLQACAPCAAQLQEFRKTMALLEEWEAAEPSEYFDTRLAARLREEKAAEASRGRSWWAWLPRPAMALAAALIVAAGVGTFHLYNRAASGGGNIASVAPTTVTPTPVTAAAGETTPGVSAERGTPVGDLQTLDSDNELYADFDVLDDIDSAQNQPEATN